MKKSSGSGDCPLFISQIKLLQIHQFVIVRKRMKIYKNKKKKFHIWDEREEESKGTKLKDFVETLQSSSYVQSEISKLRHDVEEFAKQFPTIGFEKSSMKYNK